MYTLFSTIILFVPDESYTSSTSTVYEPFKVFAELLVTVISFSIVFNSPNLRSVASVNNEFLILF